MSPRKLKTDPEIIEIPARKMAVVSGKGNPQEVFGKLMPGLYKTLYTLKFDLKKKGATTFKVGAACARYLDANIADKDNWSIYIGIPVPEDIEELPVKIPDIEINLETWEYGTVAQILHIGAYDKETVTVERLLKFIEDNGYEVIGVHEEEYLTTPKAKVMKTLIRYPVKKK
jgi:hypothetical protein